MIKGDWCGCDGPQLRVWSVDSMGKYLPAVFVHLTWSDLHGDWRNTLGTVAEYQGGP